MASSSDPTAQSDVSKLKLEADGSFKRAPSSFRDTIEKDGKFKPEKDRYHLYVSYGCPWAHRTLITRKLKGLEELIGVSIVSPISNKDGWSFASESDFPLVDSDPLYNSRFLKEIYFRADPNYSGRFTVPVLWDKKLSTIVNNESSEIIRIFNTAFNDLIAEDKAAVDIYPAAHRAEIDSINEWVYDTVNNGVYKTGFATTQSAYENAIYPLFASLDKLEKILTGKEFLVGEKLTEADIRLYVTVVRFDPAYVGIFKCNIKTIRSGYPAIHAWLKKLYWTYPEFQTTTNFEHIKSGYHSLSSINPHKIVPVGPVPDIEAL